MNQKALIIGLLLLSAVSVRADPPLQSTDYTVYPLDLNVAGDVSTNGDYHLYSSTGQAAVVDGASSISYRIQYGFHPAALAPDCNSNGVPDMNELAANDCDTSGALDACEIASALLVDCNGDNTPDVCQIMGNDCNTNGQLDVCEAGCESNGIPDPCQLIQGDCNTNGVPDGCEGGCNTNGIPDICEPSFMDCNTNGLLDLCEVANLTVPDCNSNGIFDRCESGYVDCNTDGFMDSCQPVSDVNTNGVQDICDGTAVFIAGRLVPPTDPSIVAGNAIVRDSSGQDAPTLAFYDSGMQRWYANPVQGAFSGDAEPSFQVVRMVWRGAGPTFPVIATTDHVVINQLIPNPVAPGYQAHHAEYYLDWFRDLQNPPQGFVRDIPLRTAASAPSYTARIRLNHIIRDITAPGQPDDMHLDQLGSSVVFEPTCLPGKVLIQYSDGASLIGFELLTVRDYLSPGATVATIGRRVPKPARADNSKAIFHRNVVANNTAVAWQRTLGSPNPTTDIFPIRPESNATNFAVSWWKANPFGNIWPVAITRHTTAWPEQNNARGEPGVQKHVVDLAGGTPVGSRVLIPSATYCGMDSTDILYQQSIDGSGPPPQSTIVDGYFTAVREGYSVVRFESQPVAGACGDQVKFEVIASYDHLNPAVRGTIDQDWPIGTQITDSTHDSSTPQPFTNGYLRSGQPYAALIYRKESAGQRNFDCNTNDADCSTSASATGQIFPVNTGTPHGLLEVWWYRQRATNVSGVYWPQKVVRYNPVWPTSTEQIVIASKQGAQLPGGMAYPQSGDTQLYDVGSYANRATEQLTRTGWNPNDEHASLIPANGGLKVYAVREDNPWGVNSGHGYALVRYRDPQNAALWRFGVHQVAPTSDSHPAFDYSEFTADTGATFPVKAGQPLNPLFPVNLGAAVCLVNGQRTTVTPLTGDALFVDRKGGVWAAEAQDDGGNAHMLGEESHAQINLWENWAVDGGCQAWRDFNAAGNGAPTPIIYRPSWPPVPPACTYPNDPTCARPLQVGQTVNMSGFVGPLQVLHDSVNLRIIDPTFEIRHPQAGTFTLPADVDFANLPPHLASGREGGGGAIRTDTVRFASGVMYFRGVMSPRDRDLLKGLSQQGLNATWNGIIDSIYVRTREQLAMPVQGGGTSPKFVSVAHSMAHPGWITLAMQNQLAQDDPLPVQVEVWQVACPPHPGAISVIVPQCVFNEKQTLQFTGDGGGEPENLVFHWQWANDPGGPWNNYNPPTAYANGRGLREVLIEGASEFTLANSYWRVRYRGYTVGCPGNINPDPSTPWPEFLDSGGDSQISEWTPVQLAEGWVQRVVQGLNPFDQRLANFHDNAAATFVSMIQQAGIRYEAPIALNCDPSNINAIGLIQAYETVLGRARLFSIEQGINYGPANDAILLAAGKISDLYMLLGNEAFADAADPTIGIFAAQGEPPSGYDPHATFCFENQVPSVLEEELAMLRGRSQTRAPDVDQNGVILATVYNRLPWNFTGNNGQVAYANNYEVTSVADMGVPPNVIYGARSLYPQGHGDAWGHYITAQKRFMDLLRHAAYHWTVKTEDVLVAGQSVPVGFQNERKFVRASAAKARTGAAATSLTFRQQFSANPAAQDGYTDANTDRAWGVTEWGRRSGQGAYLDWVASNALLDDNDDVNAPETIRKIDRTTVSEIREIGAAYAEIQSTVDQSDSGLNPLGLAANVVPFGLNPSEIQQGRTHFEQIFDRSVRALTNAVTAFDYANQNTQRLRGVQDNAERFSQVTQERELDYKARLIEIFGKPYGDDIGPNGTYAQGYDGADLYHFDYVDPTPLIGINNNQPTTTLSITFQEPTVDPMTGAITVVARPVNYNVSTADLGLVKNSTWNLPRAETGEIQFARSELLQAIGRYRQALDRYEGTIEQVESQAHLLESLFALNRNTLEVMHQGLQQQQSLNQQIVGARAQQLRFRRYAGDAHSIANAVAEALPQGLIFGMAGGGDLTSIARSTVLRAASIVARIFNESADNASLVELQRQQDKEWVSTQQQIQITGWQGNYQVQQQVASLEQLVRGLPGARIDIYMMQEGINQAIGRYHSALGKGVRLLEQRTAFRQRTATEVSQYRYQDMAFRVFRNDALQKYRAQFDMAAQYAFLAARAYDYETNLLGTDARAGRQFLTDIVKERSLGVLTGGAPLIGSGIAGKLALLSANFDVLKPQLGLNNREQFNRTFGLRWQLYRIANSQSFNAEWRNLLSRNVVADLNNVQEYRQYCHPLDPATNPNPAIVLSFSTTVQSGLNFFRWPSQADDVYPSTYYAIKLDQVGVRFANYPTGVLNTQAEVYLVPAGADVMRIPGGGGTREWHLLDQTFPLPFPLTQQSLSQSGYIPWDTLPGGSASLVRRRLFPTVTACRTDDAACMDMRNFLIGRSVWNTRWLLIIPGSELLGANPALGIQTFINGPSGNGNGVSDIKLVFRSYGYVGNEPEPEP